MFLAELAETLPLSSATSATFLLAIPAALAATRSVMIVVILAAVLVGPLVAAPEALLGENRV